MFIRASADQPIQAVNPHNPSKLFEKIGGPEHEASSGSAKNASKAASHVNLSPDARAALATRGTEPEEPASLVENKAGDSSELSDEEKQQVKELKARDAEVRTHERAHVAAAGGLTQGGIKYDTQRGPDNKEYAVGGHVNIDTAPVQGDPEATIRKAEIVRRSALAPAEPSGADRSVAAAADNTIRVARAEIAEEARAKLEESDDGSDKPEGQPKVSGTKAADGGQPSAQIRSSYAVAAYSASRSAVAPS